MTQTRQFVLVSPEEACEGHLDERGSQGRGVENDALGKILLGGALLPDLVQAGPKRDVGHRQECCVGVVLALLPVQEVDPPEENIEDHEKNLPKDLSSNLHLGR